MTWIHRAVEVEVQDLGPVLKFHVPEILVRHHIGPGDIAAGHIDENIDL